MASDNIGTSKMDFNIQVGGLVKLVPAIFSFTPNQI